jgi:hypothetical protein
MELEGTKSSSQNFPAEPYPDSVHIPGGVTKEGGGGQMVRPLRVAESKRQ